MAANAQPAETPPPAAVHRARLRAAQDAHVAEQVARGFGALVDAEADTITAEFTRVLGNPEWRGGDGYCNNVSMTVGAEHSHEDQEAIFLAASAIAADRLRAAGYIVQYFLSSFWPPPEHVAFGTGNGDPPTVITMRVVRPRPQCMISVLRAAPHRVIQPRPSVDAAYADCVAAETAIMLAKIAHNLSPEFMLGPQWFGMRWFSAGVSLPRASIPAEDAPLVLAAAAHDAIAWLCDNGYTASHRDANTPAQRKFCLDHNMTVDPCLMIDYAWYEPPCAPQ